MATGQISTLNHDNGSVTLTPKGLIGNTNHINDTTNVALGGGALKSSISGNFNIAIGFIALKLNTTGSANSANGYYALYSNVSGNYNTANGYNAFGSNTMGDFNTATGGYALPANKTGSNNTVDGYLAGFAIITGSNNTLIGANSNTSGDFTNATALGASAIVDAPNKVRIGNDNVTVIEGQVAWSQPSDRRLKENIIYTSRLGLDFINRLQTVSYNYRVDSSKTRCDGFIAQDIEQVIQSLGVPFSGLKKSINGTYSLAYSDFIIPLVNAVKEQQKQIDVLIKQNQGLEELLKRLAILEEAQKEKVTKLSTKN